tara:strand:+ start:28380 stop:28688 length:309 start_codon:yes stop_codon:yes gene_type:complete
MGLPSLRLRALLPVFFRLVVVLLMSYFSDGGVGNKKPTTGQPWVLVEIHRQSQQATQVGGASTTTGTALTPRTDCRKFIRMVVAFYHNLRRGSIALDVRACR